MMKTDRFHADDEMVWSLKSKTTKISDLHCRQLIHNSSAACNASYYGLSGHATAQEG